MLTTTELLQLYHERWTAVFGFPEVIHLDAAGQHVSTEFREDMEASSTEIEVITGEAHWRFGVAEPSGEELEEATGVAEASPVAGGS